LVIDILGERLGKQGLIVTLGELGPGGDVFRVLQPWSAVSAALLGSRLGKFGGTVAVRVRATHLIVSFYLIIRKN
jgi:hypothetical protein